MKKQLFILISFILLSGVAFGQSDNKIALNECKCNLSDMEMTKQFPITPNNDSVILCRKGSINGMDWTSFLSQKVLNDYFSIYDCQTEKYIKTKLPSVSVTYKDKSLIIFSHKEFIAYDSINEKWIERLQIYVYKEKIYAQDNQIHKSVPEFVLTPPFLTPKAIKEIDEMFENKRRKTSNISNSRLVEYLLVSALNGDEKSKERLQNFQNIIPSRFEGDEENNPSNLSESLEILNTFEKHILNHKVEYLDLKKYPGFQ